MSSGDSYQCSSMDDDDDELDGYSPTSIWRRNKKRKDYSDEDYDPEEEEGTDEEEETEEEEEDEDEEEPGEEEVEDPRQQLKLGGVPPRLSYH